MEPLPSSIVAEADRKLRRLKWVSVSLVVVWLAVICSLVLGFVFNLFASESTRAVVVLAGLTLATVLYSIWIRRFLLRARGAVEKMR